MGIAGDKPRQRYTYIFQGIVEEDQGERIAATDSVHSKQLISQV
jgi:hypothetical protein